MYGYYDSGLGGTLLLMWLIPGILVLIIHAVAASEMERIAADKGYGGTRKWFWYVFWLGIIGCLMICALPDRYARPSAGCEGPVEKEPDETEEALRF